MGCVPKWKRIPFLIHCFLLIPHNPQLRLRRSQNHIRHTVTDAFLCLLNHMTVYIRGGGYMGMAKSVADAHTVDSIKEQHAGLRMPLRYNKDKSENPLLPRLLRCCKARI